MHSAMLGTWDSRVEEKCVLHSQGIYNLELEMGVKTTQGRGEPAVSDLALKERPSPFLLL